MSSNQNAVIENYRNRAEDRRAVESRYAELEFYYTKKHLAEYIGAGSTVIELGCGTGYYAMYFAGRCRSYTGVDLTPEHIDILKEKIRNKGLSNVSALVGDATGLFGIPDESFDVVLCLGPMYHLPPDEREQVFSECRRICKKGGVAAFSYINRVGVYAGACVNGFGDNQYPNEKVNRFVLELGKDDNRSDLFFYTMPEEIEAAAEKYGFRKLKNLGTDFFLMLNRIEEMGEEQYRLLRPLLDQMAEHESCTGMSNHALLVCRKQEREI